MANADTTIRIQAGFIWSVADLLRGCCWGAAWGLPPRLVATLMNSARPDNGFMVEVDPERFEGMVAEALDGLPPELGRLMSNVAITVEHQPGPPGLLGLYRGIPLTRRTTSYGGVLPDRITIYRVAICARCRTDRDVVEQVRRTVVHEVGHHFGIDDARLRELGW